MFYRDGLINAAALKSLQEQKKKNTKSGQVDIHTNLA
jgi:hypothetical protein